ncbi:MAG: T9SS type A sorting domain-containing protein [Bacteroidetes bacterium]|nr:T9SS type A sorting domain-containing protein [Bacteroidota bacterium]
MKSSPFLFGLLLAGSASAQVSLTELSPAFTEDFSGLPLTGSVTWSNNSTLPGWYVSTDATPSVTTLGTSSGTSVSGGLFSFGTTGDRALGFIATNGFVGSSGTGKAYMGIRIKNDGTRKIHKLTLVWTGEQWRRENNAAQHTLSPSWQQSSVPVTSLTSGTWTSLTPGFTSPVTGATTGTSLDGNLPANRSANLTSELNLVLDPGGEVMIRWVDLNDSGNDHQMGIDDVSVSAVYEETGPAAIVVTGHYPAQITAGNPFSLYLKSVDGSGIELPVTDVTGVHISVGTGSGSLSGNLTGQFGAGASSAVVSGLIYSVADTPVVLTATAISGMTLAPGSGSQLKIHANQLPVKLVITSMIPANPKLMEPFSVTLEARDSQNILQTVSQPTQVFLSSSLSGFDGVQMDTLHPGDYSLTFPGLTFSSVGSAATITATRGSGDVLQAASTSLFSVTGPAVLAIKSVSSATPDATVPFQLTVQALENNGAPAAAGIDIPLNLILYTGSGTLTGTLTDTLKAGSTEVTFSSVILSLPGLKSIKVMPGALPFALQDVITQVTVLPGPVELPFTENFDYPAGTALTSTDGWMAHSNSGENPVTVISPGLDYPRVPGSGLGNAVQVGKKTGEDVSLKFNPVTSGDLYVSFLVRIDTVRESSDYFLHLSENPVSSAFFAKVSVGSWLGGYKFSISKGSGGGLVAPGTYELGTTHFLVVKYHFGPDAQDDQVSLFIDPDPAGPEPASPDVVYSIAGYADPATGLGTVCLRQGNSMPRAVVDAIRIATTWDEPALPVELASFTATEKSGGILISWMTASETANAGFFVETSVNRSAWKSEGFIPGAGTTTEPKVYEYFLSSPADPVYLRLRQIDLDGKETIHSFSQVLSASGDYPAEFSVSAAYPNPFNPSTALKIRVPEKGTLRIRVFDLLGKEIQSVSVPVSGAGEQTVSLDFSREATGSYFIRAELNGKAKIQKVQMIR